MVNVGHGCTALATHKNRHQPASHPASEAISPKFSKTANLTQTHQTSGSTDKKKKKKHSCAYSTAGVITAALLSKALDKFVFQLLELGGSHRHLAVKK